MPPVRILLTGAAGFAGHHFLDHLLAATDWEAVATASFRHRGKSDRLTAVLDGRPGSRDRVQVLTHDLTAPLSAQSLARIHGRDGVDYIVAYAAESHVDRSLADPVPFVRNNIDVMLSTLEAARQLRPRAVVLVSTDEVYGPEPGTGPHPEWAPILPSNPYAASKAAQEALAISYWRSYGVPLIIVNSMNLLSERQSPEKYAPKLIRAILAGDQVTIHGTPGDIGTRHWLHARSLADAVCFLLGSGPPALFPAHAAPGAPAADRPDRYNVAGPDRLSNLDLAERIAAIIGRPLRYRLEAAPSSRPGHDLHYGLDGSKLAATGWKPPVPFPESLEHTVRWTLANPAWLLPD
jgi:dTDP-glucose 4,6-dehydratase